MSVGTFERYVFTEDGEVAPEPIELVKTEVAEAPWRMNAAVPEDELFPELLG